MEHIRIHVGTNSTAACSSQWGRSVLRQKMTVSTFLQRPDVSLGTINNINADVTTVYPSAKWPNRSPQRQLSAASLHNHIHLKKSQVRPSDWRISEGQKALCSTKLTPACFQNGRHYFHSRDAAVQDVFRDDAAILSSICTSGTTPPQGQANQSESCAALAASASSPLWTPSDKILQTVY